MIGWPGAEVLESLLGFFDGFSEHILVCLELAVGSISLLGSLLLFLELFLLQFLFLQLLLLELLFLDLLLPQLLLELESN